MRRPHILVVDDYATNLELTRFVLEAGGLLVDAISEPDQVLPQIHRARPDLVLMDMQMPGVDGLSLVRQIKADPALQNLVVVAFTAHAMKGDEARLLAGGCDGYLAKPINVAHFADQVRALLAAGPRPAASKAA